MQGPHTPLIYLALDGLSRCFWSHVRFVQKTLVLTLFLTLGSVETIVKIQIQDTWMDIKHLTLYILEFSFGAKCLRNKKTLDQEFLDELSVTL